MLGKYWEQNVHLTTRLLAVLGLGI